EPDLNIEDFLNNNVHDGEADKPPYDARNSREQLNDDLERFLHSFAAEFGHKDRCPQAKRNGNGHRYDRDTHGAKDERPNAIAWFAKRGWVPFRRKEELLQVQFSQDGRPFAENEKEDGENEDDRADTAEAYERFNALFRSCGPSTAAAPFR